MSGIRTVVPPVLSVPSFVIHSSPFLVGLKSKSVGFNILEALEDIFNIHLLLSIDKLNPIFKYHNSLY